MKRLAILALAGWALCGPLLAQTAAPPPRPALDCPLEGVPAEQRALAAAAASQQLTDAPADGGQRGRVALDAVLANATRCAASYRWSANQRGLARQYVVMQLAREDMLRRYDAQNVNLRFIDEAVAGSRPGVELSFETLVAQVRAQGVGDNRPDSAGDITYIYLMLAYQIPAIRAGFDDPNFTVR